MSSSVSNVSSLFREELPRAPTPASSSASSSGISHAIDSRLRRPTKMNTSSSPPAPNLDHASAPSSSSLSDDAIRRARTGSNENQSPNADQNGVSFDRLLILYEMIICGQRSGALSDTNGGPVRCSKLRRSGARSSGKYICNHKRSISVMSCPAKGDVIEKADSTHQVTADDVGENSTSRTRVG